MNTLSPTSIELFTNLQRIVSEISGNEPSEITPYSHIREDLGVSPMELAQLSAMLEEQYGVKLGRDELADIETMGDLMLYIEEELG
jgi:acyl carrier protein